MNKKYFYSIAAIIGLQYIMLCAMGNKDDFKSDKLSLPGFTDGDVSSLHQNNEETYDQINLNQNNLNTEPPLKKQKIEKNQKEQHIRATYDYYQLSGNNKKIIDINIIQLANENIFHQVVPIYKSYF